MMSEDTGALVFFCNVLVSAENCHSATMWMKVSVSRSISAKSSSVSLIPPLQISEDQRIKIREKTVCASYTRCRRQPFQALMRVRGGCHLTAEGACEALR